MRPPGAKHASLRLKSRFRPLEAATMYNDSPIGALDCTLIKMSPRKLPAVAALRLIGLSLAAVLAASAPPAAENRPGIPEGSSSFAFGDAAGNALRPVTVWTWKPPDFTANSPILIVMHGKGRNGRAYRNSWVRYAERNRALLLVPEFSALHYPGSKWYQLGNIESSDYFGPPEILDWKLLRKALASSAAAKPPESQRSPALRRIWERIPAKRKDALRKALAAETLAESGRALLLKALNALLEDEKLYAPKAFPKPPPYADLILKWKAAEEKKAKGKQKPLKGSNLRRLNRGLLASAMPGCFRPVRRGRTARAKWTYLAVEHLFDHVRSITGSKRRGYLLYGHSAGGQFVHRLVMLLPEARVERAVAANSGKYLWPDPAVTYPYGLGGIVGRRDAKLLRKALGRKLLVLVGTRDTEEDEKKDPDLPTSEQAAKQGKNRLLRARNFHQAARKTAAALGAAFRWKLHEVKDVAHSNSGMAPRAAELLFKPPIRPPRLDSAPKPAL
jgi:hypothetical protein